MTDDAKLSRERALLRWLRAIRDYKPQEIEYDEFAYKRMVAAYRKAARSAIKGEQPWLTKRS